MRSVFVYGSDVSPFVEHITSENNTLFYRTKKIQVLLFRHILSYKTLYNTIITIEYQKDVLPKHQNGYGQLK